MAEELLYNSVSAYWQKKYGEKVYKIPIDLPGSCPNRENGGRGCSYCASVGTAFEAGGLDIPGQIEKNRKIAQEKYKAKKFIYYLQNYSNTYRPFAVLREQILGLPMDEGIAEFYIATRPDCISRAYAGKLKGLSEEIGRPIVMEIGLQSANPRTLEKMNRGHGTAEFVDAVLSLHEAGLPVVAHVILDYPGDSLKDAVDSAKLLSALRVEGVKIHNLYIAKGSDLAFAYNNGIIQLPDPMEYIKKAAAFLTYLDPNIVIHRLAGRVPEEYEEVASGYSWWRLKEGIENCLRENGNRQGSHFDYLDGAANRRAGL